MILTILIIGIIAGVSAKILIAGIDTYSFVTSRQEALQNAKVAMDRIVNELTLVNTYDITWMSNSRISFRDKNGQLTSFRSTTTAGYPVLYRGNDFLAGPLGLLDFDYLRANGTAAYFTSQLKKINVELAIDSAGGYGSVTLRTEIFPRTLMYDNFE